jgi:cytochrome c biogenesis protein CcmG, thiol:disulfide interchange protein DsbE
MNGPSIGAPPEPPGIPRPRGYALRIGSGFAAIVLIVVATYAATLPLGNSAAPSGPSTAGDRVTGSPPEGLSVGDLAPDFVSTDTSHQSLLEDLDGKPIRIQDFAGRPLWIVFWATWCTPCQQEAGDIRDLYQAHRSDDLAVLAVDVQEPTTAVREFVRKNGLDYAIGLDPTAAVKARYGQWVLPVHFFVDGRGVIRDRYLGQMTRELMERHLGSILGS